MEQALLLVISWVEENGQSTSHLLLSKQLRPIKIQTKIEDLTPQLIDYFQEDPALFDNELVVKRLYKLNRALWKKLSNKKLSNTVYDLLGLKPWDASGRNWLAVVAFGMSVPWIKSTETWPSVWLWIGCYTVWPILSYWVMRSDRL